MWVISKRRLREFWEEYPQAKSPLTAWYKVASKAMWAHIVDVRASYPTADAVGRSTVFNIGGNDFRLVTEIAYKTHTVYIQWVGTHAEYNKDKWKK